MAIFFIKNFKLSLSKNSLNGLTNVSFNPLIALRLGFVSIHTNCGSVESMIAFKLRHKFQLANYLNVRNLTTKGVTASDQTSKARKRVSVLGGGAWGTAIVDLIGHNVSLQKDLFEEEVIFYVRDEPLRLIIEKTRQNIRYLTAIKLPKNVKPVSSLNEALSESDVLIFVIPHQYVSKLCSSIRYEGSLPPTTIGLSLSKGLHIDSAGNLELSSQIIHKMLGIEVGVLSGANIAIEVAKRQYSETTLVNPLPNNIECEKLLRSLFECKHFKVTTSTDGPTVEMCGALKNIVAIGCGLIDGLGYGTNTKAAALSCGMKEMIRFVQLYHPNCQLSTFFESCGIGDVIASSYGGRNRKVGEALVGSLKPIGVLEKEILGGQSLQGAHTAEVVFRVLSNKQLLNEFPFLTAVHHICNRNMNAKDIMEAIRCSH